MSLSWLFVAVVAVSLANPALVAADDWDWWKTATIYQIYPRSFQDSDGDGTGDLQGIISRLGHIQEMGIDAIWMSPIFVSPMADFGYDIADFYNIDPLFGTMEDFDELIVASSSLGIRIILDFVPNHSSDESEWFIKSMANDPEYADWYIWRDPIGTDGGGNPIPPNNWIGSFNEPVWTFVPARNQFYYHIYNIKQPDLNYRHTPVKQEMESILNFWMDKGASGFRVDTVHTLVEDERYPNVPSDEAWPYWANQPETYTNVQEWRAVMDAYSLRDNTTRVIMTEAYGSTGQLMAYYGNNVNPGAHFTFNFMLIINPPSEGYNSANVKGFLDEWEYSMPIGGVANWVMGNHDQTRAASRFGSEWSIGMAMITLMMPGSGVIYNGEEIGMFNNWDITYEQTQDPQGCNAGPDGYREKSRDFERTPFQWDDTLNAGFTTGEPWLPINVDYVTLNLEAQRAPQLSHFNIYKKLIEVRKTDTFKMGSQRTLRFANENVIAIQRELRGATTYVAVVNMGDTAVTVNLTTQIYRLAPAMTIVTTSTASGLAIGATVQVNNLRLQPHSSVLLSSEATFLPCS